jgi:hypothetical protein
MLYVIAETSQLEYEGCIEDLAFQIVEIDKSNSWYLKYFLIYVLLQDLFQAVKICSIGSYLDVNVLLFFIKRKEWH